VVVAPAKIGATLAALSKRGWPKATVIGKVERSRGKSVRFPTRGLVGEGTAFKRAK
jgi:hypothetical protein